MAPRAAVGGARHWTSSSGGVTFTGAREFFRCATIALSRGLALAVAPFVFPDDRLTPNASPIVGAVSTIHP